MPEFLTFEEVACRACGAVRGPHAESDNGGMEWALCQNCWAAFQRWASRKLDKDDGPYTEDDLNGWLARKLFLDLRRYDQKGVVGRCEAVSDWMYGRRGQQCALPALIRTNEGHLLCGLHLRSHPGKVEYVNEANSNAPYEMLGAIISRLVKRDPKLLEMISAAIGLDSQPFSRVKSGHGKGASPIDLMGRTFGRLTVVSRTDRAGKGRHRYWRCRCECGTEKEIRTDALLNGYHLSCGCLRAEASRERSQHRGLGGLFLG